MNKTQSTANHVKNETFTRLLPRAFQTKIILTYPQRAQLSLSRARAHPRALSPFISVIKIITNILLKPIPEGNRTFGHVIRTEALQPARREKPVWNVFCACWCCDAHVGHLWGRLRFKTLFEVCPLEQKMAHSVVPYLLRDSKS